MAKAETGIRTLMQMIGSSSPALGVSGSGLPLTAMSQARAHRKSRLPLALPPATNLSIASDERKRA